MSVARDGALLGGLVALALWLSITRLRRAALSTLLVGIGGVSVELWVNLGDDGLREAAYRGG